MARKLECEQRKSSRTIFSGEVLRLRFDDVAFQNGRTSTREVVEHPGAVGVVALTEDKEVILVEQYRYAVEEILIEIPAGKLEPGEDPAGCAIRELAEETGFVAERVSKILEFYTSPGFATERLHLYLATGLTRMEQNTDDDEFVEVRIVKAEEALSMIRSGRIKDAKTIIGLLTVFATKRELPV